MPLGPPRVVYELHDLSRWCDELTGHTDILNTSSHKYDPTLTLEQHQYLDIDAKYPGLLQQISNIVNSRIAETNKKELDLDTLSAHIHNECVYRLTTVIKRTSDYDDWADPLGRIIMGWVDEAISQVKVKGTKATYRVGPQMPGMLDAPTSPKTRDIVIFKK